MERKTKGDWVEHLTKEIKSMLVGAYGHKWFDDTMDNRTVFSTVRASLIPHVSVLLSNGYSKKEILEQLTIALEKVIDSGPEEGEI
jgi:hypothetical protein